MGEHLWAYERELKGFNLDGMTNYAVNRVSFACYKCGLKLDVVRPARLPKAERRAEPSRGEIALLRPMHDALADCELLIMSEVMES